MSVLRIAEQMVTETTQCALSLTKGDPRRHDQHLWVEKRAYAPPRSALGAGRVAITTPTGHRYTSGAPQPP